MVKREAGERKKHNKEKSPAGDPGEKVDKVKMVMEVANCLEHEAQQALTEHNNDIDATLNALTDSNSGAWKENKRKTKKTEGNDKEEPKSARRQDPQNGGVRGRNSSGGAMPKLAGTNGNPRIFRPTQGQGPGPRYQNRGNGNRGGYRPGNNVDPKKDQQQKQTQELIEDAMEKGDDWKNGPRTFESSQLPLDVEPPKPTKPTFAEITANKKTVNEVNVPAFTEVPAPQHVFEEEIEPSVRSPLPIASPVMEHHHELESEEVLGPAAAATNLPVNREQTQDLKNEIGLIEKRTFASVSVQAGDPIPDASSFAMHAQSKALNYNFGFYSGDPVSVDSSYASRPKQNPFSLVNYSSVNIPPTEVLVYQNMQNGGSYQAAAAYRPQYNVDNASSASIGPPPGLQGQNRYLTQSNLQALFGGPHPMHFPFDNTYPQGSNQVPIIQGRPVHRQSEDIRQQQMNSLQQMNNLQQMNPLQQMNGLPLNSNYVNPNMRPVNASQGYGVNPQLYGVNPSLQHGGFDNMQNRYQQ